MSKIILITGGSDGIGASTAELAAKEGYTVCINYRQNHIAANRIIEKINDGGGLAYAFQADVSVESEVVDMFASIDSQVGRIDALVNNAGITEPQHKLVDMSVERLHKVFAVNVIGSFLCAREAIKR